jgi:protein-S-isoprenylcysteine O-methyltransferase Ste14
METFEKLFVGILLTVYFIGFIIKNIVTVKRTKQAIKGKSSKVNLLISNSTLLYLLTYFYIFFNPEYLVRIDMLDLFFIKIVGLTLITIAFILGITTLIGMKDSWRVGIRPEQKTDLIVSGNFVFSRNPYFLSYDLMFLGIFLVFPTLVYLIFYFIFIIIVHLMIIDEEKHLFQQHGDSYIKYKDSVNRYFSIRFKTK